MFDFDVIPGPAVQEILRSDLGAVIDLVRRTYLWHAAGESINPDSYFLRFPEKPEARIIALPAFLGADVQRAGIKWIASFPRNTEDGLPRASAVLVLNDFATGYPIACLEAATISSARTAASAALAATTLRPGGFAGSRIGIVGAGVIARNICEYLRAAGCVPDEFLVHDRHQESGAALVRHLREQLDSKASIVSTVDDVRAAETVVFATTAAVPYVTEPFRPGQVVLNISLRDLDPDVILNATNILDDLEHCLKANTSPHLAEQRTGNRDFVTGTLADVLEGSVAVPADRPVIFSPFGLGVLDIAVGAYVHQQARERGVAIAVPDFFAETRRW